MGKVKGGNREVVVHTTWKNSFKRDWQLYLMLLFPIVMVILFNYASYPGMRMIFMDYKPAKGYSGSEWVPDADHSGADAERAALSKV